MPPRQIWSVCKQAGKATTKAFDECEGAVAPRIFHDRSRIQEAHRAGLAFRHDGGCIYI